VLTGPVVNVDETGWSTAGQRTLWTATNEHAAIFKVAEDRHRDRLLELIGEQYAGIVSSDRWWAYDLLDPECRQACWAHLKRDFARHADGLAEQQTFGQAALALTSRLFSAWHALDEHHDRDRLAREMAPIQTELHELLQHAARKSARTKYHRRFANNLLKLWPALWTFVTTDGVEPTNNAAERALRGPVISRRLSHGTRSTDGERFVERALSASLTCRLQTRSLFAYLADLLTAHARGDPLPTLA
jgi:transposase